MAPFEFKYCNAKKVAKIIKGLSNTAAVDTDGIPVIVLKLATDVLAGPISHVLNTSLSTGKVPMDFKRGIVKPIHKGGGKNRKDPGSYRPVCILGQCREQVCGGEIWRQTGLNFRSCTVHPAHGGHGGPLRDALNITYADDLKVWSIAHDCAAIKTNLEALAKRFVSWACGNGLAVNASKTQFLVSSNGGNYDGITVNVDGKSIAAKNTFNLLGVTYNRKLNTDPHNIRVAAAVKQRAGLIARLGHHLPGGVI
jgi:hypothetical protein